MRITTFHVPRMDCAAEERIVRMALEPAEIRDLHIDLQNRQVAVTHRGSPDALLNLLLPLKLGARIIEDRLANTDDGLSDHTAPVARGGEGRTLRLLLAINGTMFLVEVIVGWLAQSTGLLADSLDMFADAAVYGVSLYAVGRGSFAERRAARISGLLQLVLALGALGEVARRFVVGSSPESIAMMGIALLALLANITCLALIFKHRQGGVHMRASWIFSTNDVIANIGVVVAGALVGWTGSHLPDLVIGAVIGVVVLMGALRILRISRVPLRQ